MSSRLTTVVYERPGPVSDMFVPHRVVITFGAAPRERRLPTLVCALLLLLGVPVLVHESGTIAYFADQEATTGNTFAAGPLAFGVLADHNQATLIAGEGSEPFVLTLTPQADSLPISYSVVASTTGDAAFCSAITASGGAPLPYAGALATLATAPTDSLSPWTLALTLPANPPGVVDGMTCTVDLTYHGYQQGGAPGSEYHDDQHVQLLLTADPPILDAPITPALDTPSEGTDATDTPPTDVGTPSDDPPAVDTPPDPPPPDTSTTDT